MLCTEESAATPCRITTGFGGNTRQDRDTLAFISTAEDKDVCFDVTFFACVQVCVEGPTKRLLSDLIGGLPGGGLPSGAWLRRFHKKRGRKLYTASSCSTAKYRVKRGDFCSSIISKNCGGSVATFKKLNRGFVCTNDKLYVGQILCTLVPG